MASPILRVTAADLLSRGLPEPVVAAAAEVRDVLDWAHAQSDAMLRSVIAAMDAAGSMISRVIQWAATAGDAALSVAGEVLAAFEISASAAATVFTLLLEWFPGSYRPLSATERADADNIFGVAVPLDQVRLAVMSLPVDFIEWVNGGRAFTTMFLINFASWTEIKSETLMHELTHVWQGMVAGPIYMVEALEAQAAGEGYNYGYTNDETGEGAQDRLNAAAGNFSAFNREQQAQIIMHYFVRRYEKALDYTAWQPYANIVHA